MTAKPALNHVGIFVRELEPMVSFYRDALGMENLLMGHPAVLEACVVGVPDERWGERPLATVVLREGSTATAAMLRDHLAGSLAHWQLPERWAFIEAIPKTSVGKFDKKRVRAQHANGSLTVSTVPS